MSIGKNCATSCRTKDHESFGACLRSQELRVAYCNSANGQDYTKQKMWDAELDLYRGARAQGVQPATTKTADVRAALDISGHTGTAYQAG